MTKATFGVQRAMTGHATAVGSLVAFEAEGEGGGARSGVSVVAADAVAAAPLAEVAAPVTTALAAALLPPPSTLAPPP